MAVVLKILNLFKCKAHCTLLCGCQCVVVRSKSPPPSYLHQSRKLLQKANSFKFKMIQRSSQVEGLSKGTVYCSTRPDLWIRICHWLFQLDVSMVTNMKFFVYIPPESWNYHSRGMKTYLWPRMETILSFQNKMILFHRDLKSKNLGRFLCLKNRDYFAWRCNWNYYWRLPVDGLVKETDKILKDTEDTPSHYLQF